MNTVMTPKREAYVRAFQNAGVTGITSRNELRKICEESNLTFPYWIKKYRTDTHGVYDISALFNEEATVPERKSEFVNVVKDITGDISFDESGDVTFVPRKFPGYVPFGYFNDCRDVISSNQFFPTYVTGLSGNGKTMMIEEICARLGREMIRANITGDTDEDDLIGGFRLIKGETVWQDGPVVTAMKRGAILLLDEVDLGTPKLMCLQPVLEGKPIFIKKTNTVVKPKAGFNVFATANTKGKGSADGQFIGTMIMNEAFLERFALTLEQEYPPLDIEREILTKQLQKENISDPDFVDCLVTWSAGIREMYQEGTVSDLISTRRLVYICGAYAIFGKDKDKTLDRTLSRFSTETKEAFIDYYGKIDAKLAEDREEAKRRKEIEEARKAAMTATTDPSAMAAAAAATGGKSNFKKFPF